MKKILAITGVGLATLILIIYALQKAKNKESEMQDEPESENDMDENDNVCTENTVYNLNRTKSSVGETISERHACVSEIAKDTIEEIYKNSKDSESDTDDLEDISNGLDDLLK